MGGHIYKQIIGKHFKRSKAFVSGFAMVNFRMST